MSPFTRRKARRFLLQALYEWQLSGNPLNEIEAALREKMNPNKVDIVYFHEVLHAVPARLDEIDPKISTCIDRPLNSLNYIELAALRLGAYELLARPDIPFRVAINEAVEVTKIFGSVEGHKFVNGVLNKLARELRAVEISHNG